MWTSSLGVYRPKGSVFGLVCFDCPVLMSFDHDCAYCNDYCNSCLVTVFTEVKVYLTYDGHFIN